VTAQAAATNEPGAPRARPARRGLNWSWLGVLPFFLFALLFMLFPIGFLIIGSFQDSANHDAFTLKNYGDLTTQQIARAFSNSIEISLVTAIAGAVFGLLLAYAVILGGLPRFFRTFLMTFSGVASNFAGIPLALAFIFTVGNAGLLTAWILAIFHVSLVNDLGLTLYTKIGLEVVYFYFQLPLMVLIIAPAIDGLKKEWRGGGGGKEAAPAPHCR